MTTGTTLFEAVIFDMDGVLYVGTFGNTFYALDAATGEQRWTFATNYWVWDTPNLNDGVLYFTDLQGTVYAVNAADGTEKWRKAATGFTRAAPAFAASIAESAICFGERGTCGERSCVPPEPVTAQVMKTSRFMESGISSSKSDPPDHA